MGDSRSGRALLCALAAPLALSSLAGCVGGPATPPVTPAQVITGPSGHPTDSAAAKAAGDAALAAYKGYLQAYVTAGAHRNWDSKTIDKYTADPARTQAHLSLRDQSDDDIVFQGQPVSTPIVTVVNVDQSPNAVSIADCIDATNWHKYNTKENKLIAVTPQRYGVTALVVDYPDFGWLVQRVDTSATKC